MEEQKDNVEVKEEVTEDKTPIEEKLDKLEKEGKIPKAGEEDVQREEKELTPEQEKVVADTKAKQEEKQKEDLAKKEQAYKMLQQGAYFMKFIFDDIERQKKEHLNRSQRRRFEKELRKGIFSRELVDVYTGKIDVALEWIESNINNSEQTKNRVATHYHTYGFEKPEYLKAVLEDFFKGQFVFPGEEDGEEISDEEMEKLKTVGSDPEQKENV